MPIYEYRCNNCSSEFDVRRSFGDVSSCSCPSCQGEAQRVFSPVPIIFKGSGFYVTDHRPQEKTDSDSEKVGSSAGTESKSEVD